MKPTPTLARPNFSPNYDNRIFKKYSLRSLESKVLNKLAFQKELSWVEEKKTPVICIPRGMSDEQGGTLLKELLLGILELPVQLIIRGVGSKEYGSLFTQLASKHPHRVAIIADEDTTRRKMYAAADMALFLGEDDEELSNCLAYGAVPVGLTQEGLQDFDPVQETGNSFTARSATPWSIYATLVRAVETFKLPYDWRTIQKHCMEAVKEE